MVVPKRREVDLVDMVCQAILRLLEVYFLTLYAPKRKKINIFFL